MTPLEKLFEFLKSPEAHCDVWEVFRQVQAVHDRRSRLTDLFYSGGEPEADKPIIVSR